MFAKLILKGIDERTPTGVEPATISVCDTLKALSRIYRSWCIAVLSSWSVLSG